jgi:hypothetical protein
MELRESNLDASPIPAYDFSMTRFASACLLGVLIATFCAKLHASDTPAVVGILEDVPGKYVGEANVRAVRVVFHKDGKEWSAFPSHCPNPDCLKTISFHYPADVLRTIAFDGRKLGEVAAKTPKSYNFYSDVGMQEIVNKDSVPTIGARSMNYSGFLSSPVFRPLVADSHPYFRDPDSWKPAQLSSDLTKLLRKRFRDKFPKVENCANPNENVLKPWFYKDENIKVLKAYGSAKKWFLAEIQLGEYGCDGPADDAFGDLWFVISPKGEIKFLDMGMWLVDAGDYDNDGRSELIFSIDRYNRGGYELFYDEFSKSATFEFNYH